MKRHFINLNPLISLFFIDFTLILLIAAFDSADFGIYAVWSPPFSVSEIHCNDVIQLDYF